MATQTTINSPKAWAPDQTGYSPDDLLPESVFRTCASIVGSIEGDEPSVRVPFVADDGDAAIVPEADAIPEDDPEYDEVAIFTKKVAKLSKHSYEALTQERAAQMILNAHGRAVQKKADTFFLTQAAPVAPAVGPTGVLNLATDGGTLGTNLDGLIDAISDIEANGGQATNIVAGPDAWASLRKIKTQTGSNAPLLGSGTEAAQRVLENVPVFVSSVMTGLLVLDKSAIVAAESNVRVDRSSDAYFANDVVALRTIYRIGWGVERPERVIKLTLS